MRTILIVLGDNDFGKTFIPLLETLKRIIEWKEKLFEDHIQFIIKQGMMWHYLTFQHHYELDDLRIRPIEDTFSNIFQYLNEKVRILFDSEAEEYIASHDLDGGSWYLEIQSGVIKDY